MAHTFLRNDGQFIQVAGGDIGISTTTTTGYLTYFNTVSVSTFTNTSSSVYTAVASVAQGSSGAWLVHAWLTLQTTLTAGAFAAVRITDGTNIWASAQDTVPGTDDTCVTSLSAIATSPAGNLQVLFRATSSANPVSALYNISGDSKDSGIMAIRIG